MKTTPKPYIPSLDEARAFIDRHGPYGAAARAGWSSKEGVFRHYKSDAWNPTYKTLARLGEAILAERGHNGDENGAAA